MKALAIVGAILALIVLGLYYGGAFTMEDPAEAADKLRTDVKPGMTWRQVAEIRQPRKIIAIDIEAMSGRGGDVPYDEGQLEQMMSAGRLAEGFIFEYNFSQNDKIGVYFDADGTVYDVRDEFTVGDLFNMPRAPR